MLKDRGLSTPNTNLRVCLSPFHAACEGRHDVLGHLLDEGLCVDAVSAFGRSALHEAASSGRETVVRLLLDRGADVSATDDHGRTSVHLAMVRVMREWSG
ncbi:ankyrin repeat-containing domain protein [Tricharina praecox]|uniref:ankyrin repeat-containing domain protein n=1 Tax=Tricharina praecox TaxID=43433 RepID=UPI00221EEF13|nr:ankyrin repeat-containing domain protein [Tricharina praecox]KAI5845326.1 ankyrin repeat-containing domain protein [Tricharina praecox]